MRYDLSPRVQGILSQLRDLSFDDEAEGTSRPAVALDLALDVGLYSDPYTGALNMLSDQHSAPLPATATVDTTIDTATDEDDMLPDLHGAPLPAVDTGDTRFDMLSDLHSAPLPAVDTGDTRFDMLSDLHSAPLPTMDTVGETSDAASDVASDAASDTMSVDITSISSQRQAFSRKTLVSLRTVLDRVIDQTRP